MKRPAALMLLLALSLPAAAADTPNSDSDGQNEADKPTLIERVKSKLSPKSDEAAAVLKLKYPVRIEAQPADVKEMLQEHLPLITQQLEEELDAEQMEFLAEEAPEQVLTMLKTKGYFNGKVTVSRKGIGYLVSVDSGPKTKIDNVSVAILGDVLQDENLGAYYRSAMENWSLPVGATFSQEEWSGSKSSVLSAVRRKKYPLAEFSSTQATVDPTKHQADLSVSVDSGRPIYFGEFEISGNKRYPAGVVRGLAQFDTGSPYDLDKLLDYQQALEQDSHYSGASVQADFDRLEGDRVPVKVTVSEMKKHKLELGLSYDSEYGLGGKFGYDYYNLFNKGYTGSFVASGDKYEQTVALGVSQPRQKNGHYWTSSLAYNRKTTQKLDGRCVVCARPQQHRIAARHRIRRRPGQNSRSQSRFGTLLRHHADGLMEKTEHRNPNAAGKRLLPRCQRRHHTGQTAVFILHAARTRQRGLLFHAGKQKNRHLRRARANRLRQCWRK